MSEYVVELGNPHKANDGSIECLYDQREQVIRCRDCRFSTFEACVGDYIGHGTCRRAPVGPAHLVQFSGFCAWAEPKEES